MTSNRFRRIKIKNKLVNHKYFKEIFTEFLYLFISFQYPVFSFQPTLISMT